MERRIENKRILLKASEGAVRMSLGQNGFRQTGNYSVFSLYFDDANLTSYSDHVNGSMKRSKFRLRAYKNETGQVSKNVFFETKSKYGNFGTKIRTLLPEEINAETVQGCDCLKLLLRHSLSKNLFQLPGHGAKPNLIPTFFITYRRQRFGSIRSETEFNLDTNITATSISRLTLHPKHVRSDFQVLEEKYKIFDPRNRVLTNRVNHISYPSAFSKYIWAVENSLYN